MDDAAIARHCRTLARTHETRCGAAIQAHARIRNIRLIFSFVADFEEATFIVQATHRSRPACAPATLLRVQNRSTAECGACTSAQGCARVQLGLAALTALDRRLRTNFGVVELCHVFVGLLPEMQVEAWECHERVCEAVRRPAKTVPGPRWWRRHWWRQRTGEAHRESDTPPQALEQ